MRADPGIGVGGRTIDLPIYDHWVRMLGRLNMLGPEASSGSWNGCFEGRSRCWLFVQTFVYDIYILCDVLLYDDNTIHVGKSFSSTYFGLTSSIRNNVLTVREYFTTSPMICILYSWEVGVLLLPPEALVNL